MRLLLGQPAGTHLPRHAGRPHRRGAHLHRRQRQRGHPRRAGRARRAAPPGTAAAPGAGGRRALLVGPAVRRAHPDLPVHRPARRRLPRRPVRLRDQLRGRQQVARPRRPGRPDRRRPGVPGRLSADRVMTATGHPAAAGEDAADWAARLAGRLPAADVGGLAGAPAVRALRAATAAPVVRTACDELLAWIDRAGPAYLAGLLAGAARAIQQARRNQSVDVVWTGPESAVTTGRLTAAAVTDLIEQARREILLVSYATQTEQGISAALQAASARGVSITLLAERHADNPGYAPEAAPFPGLHAARRPPGAALHAKIIVVDDRIALVGSANLTSRAMETNLECGILIRGGPQPRAIRDHITGLRAAGVLLPV